MRVILLPALAISLCASVALSAPTTAKNTKTNTTKSTATKAKTTKKASAKKKNKSALVRKSDDKTRGKVKTYGLMPSELNKLNQSVYHADAEAIRGARDTESALRYIPFITIVNTAGFGQQFDLRGQGRLSANGVKFLINGISFNPIDSYYGFMPINSVLPSLIQEVAVYPSAGARGGSINVITSKRFERPYFQVGAGYAGTLATTGTSYNAYAQAAEKFGALNLNVGAGYFQKGGPREDDSSSGFEGVLGAAYSFALGQSIVLDADFYSAKEKTTPYNSFFDSEKIDALLAGKSVTLDTSAQIAGQILTIPSYSPSKDDRKTAGAGEIEISHQRFVGSLGYEGEFNQRLKTTLTGFFAFDKRKYDTHKSTTQLYGYTGSTRNYYFVGTSDNPNEIDQSGSSFDEQKFGLRAQIDWTHDNGQLLAGLESIFEKAKRNPIQHLTTGKLNTGNNSEANFIFTINTPLNISQWTNAVFFLEKYDLTDSFSLQGGGRYQMTKSKIDASGDISADARVIKPVAGSAGKKSVILDESLEKNHDNFAFEFTPAFRYSDTGVVYGRYERGFSPVPAYAMLQRTGGFKPSTTTGAGGGQQDVKNLFGDADFAMSETQLNDESYNSYEIGFKDYVAQRQIYLGNFNLTIDALLFSANVFYTDSKNEFYFEGDPYSGLSYKTYDKSRRIGAEVALEQYFFGGGLGLNESFTYLKAQSQNADGEWSQIPYTYDYKATFGINAQVPVGRFVDVRLWLQNSFYGKQAVIGLKDEKIDPYLISDVGVSFGFNKGAAVLTAGVKNVLDTFYYDYYNNNKAASIGEYRYLLGQGRTIFVEGTYRY